MLRTTEPTVKNVAEKENAIIVDDDVASADLHQQKPIMHQMTIDQSMAKNNIFKAEIRWGLSILYLKVNHIIH